MSQQGLMKLHTLIFLIICLILGTTTSEANILERTKIRVAPGQTYNFVYEKFNVNGLDPGFSVHEGAFYQLTVINRTHNFGTTMNVLRTWDNGTEREGQILLDEIGTVEVIFTDWEFWEADYSLLESSTQTNNSHVVDVNISSEVFEYKITIEGKKGQNKLHDVEHSIYNKTNGVALYLERNVILESSNGELNSFHWILKNPDFFISTRNLEITTESLILFLKFGGLLFLGILVTQIINKYS